MTVRRNPVWTGGPNGTTMDVRIRTGRTRTKRLAAASAMHWIYWEKNDPPTESYY
jgi:hypothetical protein